MSPQFSFFSRVTFPALAHPKCTLGLLYKTFSSRMSVCRFIAESSFQVFFHFFPGLSPFVLDHTPFSVAGPSALPGFAAFSFPWNSFAHSAQLVCAPALSPHLLVSGVHRFFPSPLLLEIPLPMMETTSLPPFSGTLPFQKFEVPVPGRGN